MYQATIRGGNMNIGISLKLQVASAGLALAMVSGGCAMVAPKAERFVAAPIGSTWTQAQSNSGSYGSGKVQTQVTRGERMWQGKQVITYQTPQSAILAEPNGNWIGIVSGDKPIMTWDPPVGWDWPLEVGKTWTHSHRFTNHAKQQTIPFQSTQKVEAYEDVTVPAGTFKAFKISTSDTLGNENVNWFSPELGIFVKSINTRTAKHVAGPGRQETEIVSQTIKK
jgi:hypothetical protein